MGLLDEAIAEDQTTYTRTAGDSRMDRILADLDAQPRTAEFPQDNFDRLIEMLEAPTREWGNLQLLRVIKQICAALGVDDRELNLQNVTQWRAKRRGDR